MPCGLVVVSYDGESTASTYNAKAQHTMCGGGQSVIYPASAFQFKHSLVEEIVAMSFSHDTVQFMLDQERQCSQISFRVHRPFGEPVHFQVCQVVEQVPIQPSRSSRFTIILNSTIFKEIQKHAPPSGKEHASHSTSTTTRDKYGSLACNR